MSDKRIKNIERISNATFDLEALNKIEVTDFKYKDEVEFGTEKKKGFIAQQLETVFPEAITQRTDFIPDVYALAKSVSYHSDNHRLTLLMDKPHGLTEGITLKIITDNSKEEVRVESIVSEKEFTVSGISSMDSKQVFVFGRQVDDLRVVDYDRIFTLNVSATQELTKVVRQLEDENERLKRSTSSLQSQLNSSVENYIVLKAEVEALKRTMTVYGKN